MGTSNGERRISMCKYKDFSCADSTSGNKVVADRANDGRETDTGSRSSKQPEEPARFYSFSPDTLFGGCAGQRDTSAFRVRAGKAGSWTILGDLQLTQHA